MRETFTCNEKDRITVEQAIGWIYTLLSACNKFQPKNTKELYRWLIKGNLFEKPYKALPHLNAWLRLCQAALLIERNGRITLAILAEEWIGWSAGEKLLYLVRSWQELPADEKHRKIRKRILEKLNHRVPISQYDRRETRILEALGLVVGDGLSKLGLAVLVEQKGEWMEKPGPPPPGDLRKARKNSDRVKILPGICLQFENSADLLALRQKKRLSKVLGMVISPRHVLVDRADLKLLAGGLVRSGRLEQEDLIEWEGMAGESTGGEVLPAFTKNERAILFGLCQMAEILPNPFPVPMELMNKVSKGLGEGERNVIRKKVGAFVETCLPRQPVTREDRKGDLTVPTEKAIEFIKERIRLQESMKIEYPMQDGGMEERQVSPLLLEERYGRLYLVAYCHKRRANRTFRLDRIMIDE